MNAERNWLTLLNGATNYVELQNAFDHMSADAQSTNNSDAMIASIDEAIRRIEQERARDQSELDGFEAEYDAFKQEQSGVVGWFKRKLPFTETRKKELGHRETLSDQQAEILADNFVIARAQILKERIAPPKLRKMGHKPNHWREEFLKYESPNSISDYGRVALDLGNELLNAAAFLKTLQSDIDSFASARFSSDEDQKMSHAALGDSNIARARANNRDDHDLKDAEKRAEVLETAIREVDKLLAECKYESDRLTKLRKETLHRRGQMLLDQHVLNDINFDEV